MKIISLESHCNVKWLINKTKYNSHHNIFDKMNTFSFSKTCDLLEDIKHLLFCNYRHQTK
jgi:hypothetical protein